MLIVNGLPNTSVATLATAGVYNASYLGSLCMSHKFADAWINTIKFDTYWTEGRDGCNKISNSYWKASECNGGGVFATRSGASYCCYKRYADVAMTILHQGTLRRNMFDDDRANDAYFIWPYVNNSVYIEWGHSCSNGGRGNGEYRIWVR